MQAFRKENVVVTILTSLAIAEKGNVEATILAIIVVL